MRLLKDAPEGVFLVEARMSPSVRGRPAASRTIICSWRATLSPKFCWSPTDEPA